jgi:hypothetical protein
LSPGWTKVEGRVGSYKLCILVRAYISICYNVIFLYSLLHHSTYIFLHSQLYLTTSHQLFNSNRAFYRFKSSVIITRTSSTVPCSTSRCFVSPYTALHKLYRTTILKFFHNIGTKNRENLVSFTLIWIVNFSEHYI